MPGGSSGLARDVQLVRRRAWLFLPFLAIGVIAAFLVGSVAGQSNAVASMQLDTLVQEVVSGGDRGLRIFEAQSMTGDAEFIQQVRDAVGDQDFDYSRYAISLAPISVADGVSRGILTVSIKDDSKAEAERLRQAFVDVFTRNYVEQDGLWRQRFLKLKRGVADRFENLYKAQYEKLRPEADRLSIPLDELVRSRANTGSNLIDELNREETRLRGELAELQALLINPALITGVQASSMLDTPVTDAEAVNAIATRQQVVVIALNSIQGRRALITDGNFSEEFQRGVDELRALAEVKQIANVRLADAQVAVTSAQSNIATSYSFSGGVTGTWLGRAGVVVAVTLVGGLIAIYLVEWLMQVRRREADGEEQLAAEQAAPGPPL